MNESAREMAERIQRAVHLVRSSEFIPIEPTELQWAVIADNTPELLMGGGAGSGKSVALLAAALMYAHVPGYSALMIRKTFPDLAQPGGLMHMANDWLYNTSARKANGGKEWIFPSGAQLSFGHMETEAEKARYQGAEHSYVAFDEVTHIEEGAVLYLQSRLRQSTTRHPELVDVPLRMRLGANPGGRHAKWVKERYISDEDNRPVSHPERIYIHSTLLDNPHLNQDQYKKNLATLDPVTRAQLERGDWKIQAVGNMFAEENFIKTPGRLEGGAYRVRMWDLAGSGKKKSDFCAGVLMARSKETGLYRIEHVIHEKLEPGPLDRKIKQTAELDGKAVWIGMEEEKSGSGKLVSAHFRSLLQGYVVRPQRPTGDKVERAGLLSSLVDHNQVELTIAPWNDKFISECVGFGPNAAHDDMVDAAAYAAHVLSRLPINGKKTKPEETEAPPVEGEGGVPGGGVPQVPQFLLGRVPSKSGQIRRNPWGDGAVGRRIGGGR